MNASLLTGIAAALRGGLQGYQTAQTNQRQAALDELARKRQEDDAALRAAALQANALARKNAEDAKAKALEAAGVARERREFQAPVLAEVNKYGSSPGTEEALALTDRYIGANPQDATPIETFPVDPSGPAPDKMEELDGVTAFPESFKESKGDVLKARSSALAKAATGRPVPKEDKPAGPKEKSPTVVQKERQFDQKQMDDITKAMAPYVPQLEAIDGVDAAIKSGALNNNFWASFLMKNSIARQLLDSGTAEGRRQVTDLFVEQLKAISGGAVTDSEALRSELATFFGTGVPADQFQSAWESWKRKRLLKINAALAGKDPVYIEKWRKGLEEKRNPMAGPKGPAAALAGPQEVERKTLPNGEVWAKYADGTFKKVSP